MTGDASQERGKLVLYQADDGTARLYLRVSQGTVWLTQLELAQLFQTTKQNVSLHVRNVLSEGELTADRVVKSDLTTAADGKRYRTQLFNLDMILAVGYRVKSPRGTQFRQWATTHLREYLVKGFVLDDERLKNPPVGDKAARDHFDELLDRIRDIRASERRMYTRIRDILALAADYALSSAETQLVFQIVQNKLHHAVTGMTAPELIASRADANQSNMGLTTWGAGVVRRQDVTVAKNYLRENEVAELNRIVVMFLDFAEDQALRKKQVFLRDWQQKLDEFLRFHERDVLGGAGKVSREDAHRKAGEEYEQFAARRRAHAEAVGEADALRALEDVAKKLPKRKGRGKGTGGAS